VQTLPINEQTPATNDIAPALGEETKIGGCYVLRHDLSKPGGSPVWLATDEVLGKDVTLHFVPAAVAADARAMTELRQEVKRNRQLIHPNILRVYDFVEDGNRVAISMDAFEGESLQDVLKKKGRLDPEHVKPWVSHLAETLADAHRIQLFHRDLAPANLYLRPSGSMLAANFGLSRVILNSLERAGAAKGAAARLAYLSPQQLDGERPSASDDIYGLGVLLYELLTGAPPFAGDDLVPQIRKTVPAPVSDVRAAGGVVSPVPASWEKLIAACLAKTPEARPRNLSEVLAMLGQDSGAARPRVQPAAAVEKPAPAAESHEPAKAAGKSESAGRESHAAGATSSAPVSEPAIEKSAASKKPLHPEIPPISAAAKKQPVKGALSANFPDLDRPRSKAPLVWLLLAAGIIGVGIYIRSMPDSNEATRGAVSRIDDKSGNPDIPVAPDGVKNPVTPEVKSPDTLPDPEPVPSASGAKTATAVQPGTNPQTPKATTPPPPKPPKPGGLIGTEPPAVAPITSTDVPDSLVKASAGGADTKTPPEATKLPPDKVPVKPTPALAANPPRIAAADATKIEPLPELPPPLPPLGKIDKATSAQLDAARTQREMVIEDLRRTIAAADAAQQEATRKLDAAKLEKDKRQKEYDAKRKTLGPVIQQAEALEAERNKLAADSIKAEAAAAEAAKQAEVLKKKLDEAVAKGGDKLKARQQAESELSSATAEIAILDKEVDTLSKLRTKADTLRQQARISEQQMDQDLQKIAASSAQARRADMEAQRKEKQEKITAIEKQIVDLKTQHMRFNAALEPLKELGEAGREAIRKIEEKQKATQQQIDDLQAEVKRLSGEAGKTPVKTTGTPKPAVAPLVVPTIEKETPVAPQTATVNSLGMKFALVGDVQFSVYLTTRKDFEAFATSTNLKSDAWKNPGFKQDPNHPVVNVTWREAEAFCKWLTDKERKSGLLKPGEAYRLPTDVEWSKAVGLPAENGATPEERDMGVPDVYPWGKQWPPPADAGNYAGEETQTEIPIPNYNDNFPNTSPVGKFRANALGLYDMGGNVWQWVADFWNGENRAKTLRGGSWYNGAIPLSLLSSCRISSSPETLHDTYGFRIVKAAEPGKARHR
jgi:serine/threonine protein kinase/formylglycine-generating enzyme required for sulfatase activity